MPDLILPFSSPETTLSNAGGKGANLSALARAGFNVPPGFIVTTGAYRAFVETYQLQPRILALASRVLEDPVVLDATSSEIRALFEEHQMPDAIVAAVRSAYRDLVAREAGKTEPEFPVAVRSSATSEDLPGLAFAGQYETYLNILGEPEIVDAVKKCWGSLWTSRALAYRARNRIAPDEVALAVVVQKMIASESSGVLFTANPLTGRRDEIVIDASFGLGEAIVAGQVEPDHYVVDPHNLQIVERRLGAKALAIVPQAGGGTRQITRDAAARQALPDLRIVELASTAGEAARLFGEPQDIEWAFADGQLFLLQSRPVTSLYPVPSNPFPDSELRVYFSLNSIQGVTGPFTPLGANVLQMLLAGGFARLFQLPGVAREDLPLVGGRLYIDVTGLARDPRLRHILLGLLVRGDPGALAAFRHLVDAGRLPTRSTLTPRQAGHLLRRFLPLLVRAIASLLRPDRARVHATAALESFFQDERRRSESAGDLLSLLRLMKLELPSVFENVIRSAIPVIFPAIAGLTVVGGWLKNWLGERPAVALELMRGVPYNVTTEMDLELWKSAQAIRSNPAAVAALRARPLEQLAEDYRRGTLVEPAQHELAKFLDRYGMRAVAEIDVGRLRWRDDPSPILSSLLSYLELEDSHLAPDAVFARGQAQADKLAGELVARVRRSRFGWIRARLLRGAIRRMRALGGLRELPKFTMIQILDLYRTALLDRARILVSRGELERAEDIFFVPFDSLERFAQGERIDLPGLVHAGRAAYERERGRRQFPRLLLSNGEAFYEGMPDPAIGSAELVGDPVSPGVVEGRVRVVLDPRGVRLEPGEILVCPATDPGWTPLFLTAGGLVMEIGGLVTHGSVVAREYGIPAVVGVHNATQRLQSGQRVRVDGNRGRVTILD